jgi:hypothetical protein
MSEHVPLNPDLLITALSGTAAVLLAGVTLYASAHQHDQVAPPMPASGCDYTQAEQGEDPGCVQFRNARNAIIRQELPQATDQYLSVAFGGISLLYGFRYGQVRLVTREAHKILKGRV